MSKYNALWEFVKQTGSESFKLTFDEIETIKSREDAAQAPFRLSVYHFIYLLEFFLDLFSRYYSNSIVAGGFGDMS